MRCYAEQYNLQSAGGTSGESSICVATPVGSFIGDTAVNKYKAYQQAYQRSERGKATIKRFRESLKGKASRRKWKKSQKGKASMCASNLAYRKKYPERINAGRVVERAILQGKISIARALECSCGKQAREYHHHKGYAKENQLDVIPVCRDCHIRLHKEKD